MRTYINTYDENVNKK